MGVERRTVEVITCDICQSECSRIDGEIKVQVSSGDGRDVGPAYVHATMKFEQPYGCTNGAVCHSCKVQYLQSYLERFAAPLLKATIDPDAGKPSSAERFAAAVLAELAKDVVTVETWELAEFAVHAGLMARDSEGEHVLTDAGRALIEGKEA